VDTLVEKLKSV